jgi:L-cystine transport system substrate-binding protein
MDGFEAMVMKAVDELIPEYEFDFISTTDEDLLIGIESGKYAGGTKAAWITDERKEKYVIPAQNVGASVTGYVYRTADKAKFSTLEDFGKNGGKLVPIAPNSAQRMVVEEFNKEHPNAPVFITPADTFYTRDGHIWIAEGRYDGFFIIQISFKNQVLDETGQWHYLADQLSYAPFRAIPTYPLFNKKQQDLADKYDAAILKLRADGTIDQLSQQYFGEDIFKLIQ